MRPLYSVNLPYERQQVDSCYSRDAIAMLAEHIRVFGQLEPIKINEHNVVVDGIKRCLAIEYLGRQEIWAEYTHHKGWPG